MMNVSFKKAALLICACMVSSVYAPPRLYATSFAEADVVQQKKTVTGKVTDAMGPVIGANVLVKGTSNGVITDIDGNFSLEVEPGATLVFSYIGYTAKEVVVGNQSVINVQLSEDTELLDEVVVVGYGVQKKKLVTGATVQVKGDDIARLNTTSALGALQSQTPGVNIVASNGQPGEGFKVNIRGLGTVGKLSTFICDRWCSRRGYQYVESCGYRICRCPERCGFCGNLRCPCSQWCNTGNH